MRVLAVDSDAIVFVSDVWQTTCTAVRAGDEGFVIDSPIYPEELGALPDLLEQAGFPVSGLLATHGDWDHLLARLAFAQAALGCPESTARRLAAEPGSAQRKLRDFDAEHYVQRPGPLSLGTVQSLPVPGKLELGEAQEIECYEAVGHTGDGAAYWLGWLGILVCGDYLSPVEIPMLSDGGSLEDYRATLERLGELAARASWVIPGHGGPMAGERALEILEEDSSYLEQLSDDPGNATLPKSRATTAQKSIHAGNLARLTTASD
jgi:glyoxylase-like metal-dependent hydrolase (beta-lactamase superfamily II)